VPIACKDPGDCPIYRPGEDTWRCEHGICTFPGFKYASER
jgi:hypothetical protein